MGRASRRLAPLALWAVTAIAAGWGLRVVAIEGFVTPWSYQPIGDFAAVMFGTEWWDGTGILYEPLFVPLKWLNRASPELFGIYFFNLADIPLVLTAFAACVRAQRLRPTGSSRLPRSGSTSGTCTTPSRCQRCPKSLS